MDHFVNILVKFFVFLSRFASALSKMRLIDYRSYENRENDQKLHILLVGYNGVRNPGGMLPLTSEEADSFHSQRLPQNLYVADATLLPESLGNPPIYTILALAKRIAKVCKAAIA